MSPAIQIKPRKNFVPPERSSLDEAEINRLAHEAAAGDSAAFDELVRQVTPAILGYLRDQGIPLADAEDLAQEAWSRAVVYLRTFTAEDSFPRWMFVVVRNLRIDWLRKAGRMPTPRPLIGDEATPIREDLDDQRLVRLLACVTQLPAEQRQIVFLRFWTGRSLEEVAQLIGVSYGSVKAKCYRAIVYLRQCLGRKEI